MTSKLGAAAILLTIALTSAFFAVSAYQFSMANPPEDFLRLNPNVERFYAKPSSYTVGQGFVWRVEAPNPEATPNPHISLLVYQGQIIGVQQAFPAWRGWFPWFDQQRGNVVLRSIGPSYTQTVYFAPKPTLLHYLFGLPLPPPTLDFDAVRRLNPKVEDYYVRVSPPYPGEGERYAAALDGRVGPGLILTVWEEEVTGVIMMTPSVGGLPLFPWRPWFDQPEGKPAPLPTVGEVYTQHLRFQRGPSLQEVAASMPPLELAPTPSDEGGVRRLYIQVVEWGFNQRAGGQTIRVTEGQTVKIIVENRGELPHSFTVEGLNVGTAILGPGLAETLEFTPRRPGEYVYYDAYPGHRELGMKGKLIVEPKEAIHAQVALNSAPRFPTDGPPPSMTEVGKKGPAALTALFAGPQQRGPQPLIIHISGLGETGE